MDEHTIDPGFSDELISICRTVVGDELRSITYFTEDEVEQLYLRSDLDRTADLVGFADHERLGFRSSRRTGTRSSASIRPPSGCSRTAS